MVYETPTDPTTLVAVMQWLQTIIPFGELLLAAIFVIAFLFQKRYQAPYAVTTSMFLCVIVSTLLYLMSVLPPEWIYFTTLASAISIMLIDTR